MDFTEEARQRPWQNCSWVCSAVCRGKYCFFRAKSRSNSPAPGLGEMCRVPNLAVFGLVTRNAGDPHWNQLSPHAKRAKVKRRGRDRESSLDFAGTKHYCGFEKHTQLAHRELSRYRILVPAFFHNENLGTIARIRAWRNAIIIAWKSTSNAEE